MGNRNKAPFRHDVVGSFLRPAVIHEARRDFEAGKISAADLRKIEDEEIKKLVAKEKENGLLAVTDGEFRRTYWHLDFLENLQGIKKVAAEAWSVAFKGHQPKAATIEIEGKIGFGNHPFVKDFEYLKSVAGDAVAKMTIPSPSMLHLICCVREEHYKAIDLYKNEDDLYRDIALAYQEAIKTFYAAGCRYLQLDDTSWGEFCDAEKRKAYAARGLDLNKIAQNYVKMINLALEAKPDDMVITMHICRGNFRSTWFSSGGYDVIAETLFGNCKVDGFFLEYDSDRAGGFKPLAHIKNQQVVLGLVTSKFPELEKYEDVAARVEEATLYVPKDQLCLSPQCGFASTEEGNALTEEEQWAKVRMIRDYAEKIWG